MNLHFFNRYEKFIKFYQQNLPEGLVERHHIVPKCLGGTDELTNLVLLPTRAHFIAHYILYKSYPNEEKLAHAFAMMGVNNKHQKRSSRLYEKSKLARSNALKGKPRPEWVKEKLRKPKTNTANYKKEKSLEHREAISKGLRGKPKTKEHIEAIVCGKEKLYENMRIAKQNEKEWFINEFKKLNLNRKEFCKLYPDVKESKIRRYIQGI